MPIGVSALVCCPVALLAEGVDRNRWNDAIEDYECWVALLAEGVDRNVHRHDVLRQILESPSSRRAWIEIMAKSDYW